MKINFCQSLISQIRATTIAITILINTAQIALAAPTEGGPSQVDLTCAQSLNHGFANINIGFGGGAEATIFKFLDNLNIRLSSHREHHYTGRAEAPSNFHGSDFLHFIQLEVDKKYSAYIRPLLASLKDTNELLLQCPPDQCEWRDEIVAEKEILLDKLKKSMDHVLPSLFKLAGLNGDAAIVEIGKGLVRENNASLALDYAGVLQIYQMYMRLAKEMSWQIEILNEDESGKGISQLALKIVGPNAFQLMQLERGTHRFFRLGRNSKIHTQAVPVEVYEDTPKSAGFTIRDNDIRTDLMRSSGPGGQHVNTTDSGVRLTHLPTGLTVNIQSTRSQFRNKAIAREFLFAKVSRYYQLEEEKKNRLAKDNFVSPLGERFFVRTYRPEADDPPTTKLLNGSARNLELELKHNLMIALERRLIQMQAESWK